MIDPTRVCMRCMHPVSEGEKLCRNCGAAVGATENASHQLPVGSILSGCYLVGAALGQGGFGITYIGWDLNLDAKVAIKEYYPDGCVTRDLSTRTSVISFPGEKGAFFLNGKQKFVEEAKTLARFSGDPNIVNVRTFFSENGTTYLVMDYVAGETLKDYAVRCGGRLKSAELLALMEPLVGALTRVHEAGLLHRDISPDNIILQSDGSIKLLDFGAARLISAMGERSLTINVKHGFAPEEQYRTHGEQGPWTDVYALAATIYRLATGVTPPPSIDRLAGEADLTPPNALGADFTPAQQRALLHGLALRMAERTQDMQQFKKELYAEETIEETIEEPAAAPDKEKEPKRQKRVKRWPLVASAAAVLLLGAGLAVLLTRPKPAQQTTDETQPTEFASFSPAPAQTVTPVVTDAPTPGMPLQVGEPSPAGSDAALESPGAPVSINLLSAGDFLFATVGSTACIADYTGDATQLDIPARLGEYAVTAIAGNAFQSCTATSITIPEGVASIGDYAFGNCWQLKRLYVPASVTSIGRGAFAGGIDSFRLTIAPDNPAYTVENGVLYSKDKTLLHSMLREIGTGFTVPAGVTAIGDCAFSSCTNWLSVTIPEGVTSIGEEAFRSCYSLASIHIPASVTQIGAGAFMECEVLRSIDVAADNPAFAFENGILYSKDKALLHTALMSCRGALEIPVGVTRIAEGAFYYSGLRSVTVPEGVKEIGRETFACSNSLTSVSLPNGLVSIGKYAFGGCPKLKEISLPDSVRSIGADAFCDDDLLTAIRIPAATTSIGAGAFAFSDALSSIDIAAGNTAYIFAGNSLYSRDMTLLHTCLASARGVYTVPVGVTRIEESAFTGCKGLTSITIPDSVTSIGGSAFYECKALSRINIPVGVTSIEPLSFCYCVKLESVVLPEGMTRISEGAFSECGALKSITIPESVTSIGDYAFNNCHYLTIRTPAGSYAEAWAKKNGVTVSNY